MTHHSLRIEEYALTVNSYGMLKSVEDVSPMKKRLLIAIVLLSLAVTAFRMDAWIAHKSVQELAQTSGFAEIELREKDDSTLHQKDDIDTRIAEGLTEAEYRWLFSQKNARVYPCVTENLEHGGALLYGEDEASVWFTLKDSVFQRGNLTFYSTPLPYGCNAALVLIYTEEEAQRRYQVSYMSETYFLKMPLYPAFQTKYIERYIWAK